MFTKIDYFFQQEKTRLVKQMQERENRLKGIYQQVAVVFADLHDRAERMQEKGVITVSASALLFSDNRQLKVMPCPKGAGGEGLCHIS